jgi:hypothetical protein
MANSGRGFALPTPSFGDGLILHSSRFLASFPLQTAFSPLAHAASALQHARYRCSMLQPGDYRAVCNKRRVVQETVAARTGWGRALRLDWGLA